MSKQDDAYLPAWFWLWLPVVLYFGHYLVRAVAPVDFWDQYILTEFGFTEEATFAMLVLALLAGLVVLRRVFFLNDWRLLIFFALFCLGCFYFGGEEVSWGQHWFGWSAPGSWDTINGQDETNLHNLNGTVGFVFNNLPRDLLGLVALIGGVIIPWVRHVWGSRYQTGSFAYWIMPGVACIPSGLTASLATIPQKVSKASVGDVPWWLHITAGEVKELMIAVFLSVYICLVWARLRAAQRSPAQATAPKADRSG